MESRILSALISSRSNYEQVKDIVGDSFSSTFSPFAQIVAKLLEDYYTRDGSAKDCRKEILLDRAEETASNPKHVKAIQDVIRGLEETVSVPNLLHDLRQQRRRRIGDKLAGLLANREQSREVDDLIKQYQEFSSEREAESGTDESSVYRGVGVGPLIDTHFSREGTISFGIPKLDEICDGGARPGHHILIYARPEIGKTLFTLRLVRSYVNRGYVVLYCGNEEPMCDTVLRLICGLTGRTKEQIRADPEGTDRILAGVGYANFIGVNLSPGKFPELETLVDEYEPDIVVVDQLRNIDVGDDNRVTGLEKAATGARNLAKSRDVLTISITQAGESAEGKLFLGLSDIDFSKTGIPGAIDLALGIGTTDEYRRANIRGVSTPKNKLGGKYGQFLTRIDPRISEVEVLDS